MDHDLLMTLIERWRQKTQIFHLRVGKMTPTLHDIVVLLGLPIDGQACTAVGIQDAITLCKYAFGRVSLPEMFKGNTLSMRWLWKNFFKFQWYVNAY
jgi:hypothetical protein